MHAFIKFFGVTAPTHFSPNKFQMIYKVNLAWTLRKSSIVSTKTQNSVPQVPLGMLTISGYPTLETLFRGPVARIENPCFLDNTDMAWYIHVYLTQDNPIRFLACPVGTSSTFAWILGGFGAQHVTLCA